jgi:hypothetical protein
MPSEYDAGRHFPGPLPTDLGRWADRCLRWSLGGLFVVAGALKLAHPQDFALVLEAFGLLPDDLIRVVAVALPVVEVLAGAGLVGNLRGSLGALAALLAVFMGVLGYALHLGLDIDCGCFGPLEPEGRAYAGIRPALYRDALMGAGVLAIYAGRLRWGIRPIVAVRFARGRGGERRCADEA